MSIIASIPFGDIFGVGFVAIAIITALLLTIGHFFPWEDAPRWMTGGRPLSRVKCYVYGTLSVFVPLCVWLLILGYAAAVVLIVANVTVAGLTVFACYGFDRWRAGNKAVRQALKQAREAARQSATLAQEAEEREKQLRSLLNAGAGEGQ